MEEQSLSYEEMKELLGHRQGVIEDQISELDKLKADNERLKKDNTDLKYKLTKSILDGRTILNNKE